MILSMIISGLIQPGNNIDFFYLSSLIEDLKFLWEEGIGVNHTYSGENLRGLPCCFAQPTTILHTEIYICTMLMDIKCVLYVRLIHATTN